MQSIQNREKIKRRIKKNGICIIISVIATLDCRLSKWRKER